MNQALRLTQHYRFNMWQQEQEKAKEGSCSAPNLIVPKETLSTKLEDFSYSSSTNSLLYQSVTERWAKENDSCLLEETTTRCQMIVNAIYLDSPQKLLK